MSDTARPRGPKQAETCSDISVRGFVRSSSRGAEPEPYTFDTNKQAACNAMPPAVIAALQAACSAKSDTLRLEDTLVTRRQSIPLSAIETVPYGRYEVVSDYDICLRDGFTKLQKQAKAR